MCFSATASFSVGALLLGLGTFTLKSARRPRAAEPSGPRHRLGTGMLERSTENGFSNHHS